MLLISTSGINLYTKHRRPDVSISNLDHVKVKIQRIEFRGVKVGKMLKGRGS